MTFPSDVGALYAQKHNPFVYFDRIAAISARLAKLKLLEELPVDLSGAAPNFAFIVPNRCHDGHDLPMCDNVDRLTHDYDSFVERIVGAIRGSPNWTQNSAIVITFDEGETQAEAVRLESSIDPGTASASLAFDGNHIATIVVTKCGGPAINDTVTNHYGLLATIEDGFALPRLRKAESPLSHGPV